MPHYDVWQGPVSAIQGIEHRHLGTRQMGSVAMRRFLQDLRAHAHSVKWFGGLILLVWAVTLATWVFEDGISVGMPGWMFAIHMLMPVVAGGVVGTWPGNSMLAGALVYAADSAMLLPWSLILIAQGRVDASVGSPLEAIPFIAIGLIFGAVLGGFGGILGRVIAGRRGGSRSAAG